LCNCVATQIRAWRIEVEVVLLLSCMQSKDISIVVHDLSTMNKKDVALIICKVNVYIYAYSDKTRLEQEQLINTT
jgi:hypothetical protein